MREGLGRLVGIALDIATTTNRDLINVGSEINYWGNYRGLTKARDSEDTVLSVTDYKASPEGRS
jgi:hypothetical protein